MRAFVDDDAADVSTIDDDGAPGEWRASLKVEAVGAAGVIGAVEGLADDVDPSGPPVDLAHDVAALFGCLDVVAEIAVAGGQDQESQPPHGVTGKVPPRAHSRTAWLIPFCVALRALA
jgi:hypothetical protein